MRADPLLGAHERNPLRRLRCSGSRDDENAIEPSKVTRDEKKLLTLYREASELDRRYIDCGAEVLVATLG